MAWKTVTLEKDQQYTIMIRGIKTLIRIAKPKDLYKLVFDLDICGDSIEEFIYSDFKIE